MGQRRPQRVAFHRRHVQPEALAGLEIGAAARQFADAQLRSLQVHHDADRPPRVGLDLPEGREALAMIGMGAMAEIQAKDIGAGIEQRADDRRRCARRSQRGHDLGLALSSLS